MPAVVPPPPSRRVLRLPRQSARAFPFSPAAVFDRRLAMFSALLITISLFVSGLVPGLLVGTVVGSCAVSELTVVVDTALLSRRPLADVVELRPRA